MERLQGPINHSCFFGEHFDQHNNQLECLEEEHGLAMFEEEIEDKMPFLQMLQSVETSQSFWPLKEPSFQTLLKLQHLKRSPWELYTTTSTNNPSYEITMESQIQGLDFESCVDYESSQNLHVKTEVRDYHNNNININNHLLVAPQQQQEELIVCKNQEVVEEEEEELRQMKETQKGKLSQVSKERKKRKRARPMKNKEEVESQRMTHIAVERNRRRQMNDHLNVLRSLMPNSYIQRGDQASIVGGAIDFVKELEQLLQSLEAQKGLRITSSSKKKENSISISNSSSSSSTTTSVSSSSSSIPQQQEENNKHIIVGDEVRAENKSESADIETTVIQTHVNLKIRCPKRSGQLLKAIVALEDLKLSVLHLNITSSLDSILYSFNLKIEDECQLGSADEIAEAVHRIFRIIDQS